LTLSLGNPNAVVADDGLIAPNRGSWLEGRMTDTPRRDNELVPIGQRLLDRPFLLLLAGLVVMFGFYTLWGLYEILTLPRATLP
jgi:hypothetical protein